MLSYYKFYSSRGYKSTFHRINKNTIKKAIEDGAKTVDDIKEMTEASTGCGGCEDEIQEILDELLK